MADAMKERAIPELKRICGEARLFVSMPFVEGLTPRILMSERGETYPTEEPLERRHGIFAMDEIGLPALDRGGLYGDGVFEGILVTNGRVFTLREHLARFGRSAERIGIPLPYTLPDLTRQLLKTIQETELKTNERGYVRLVATRGQGDLGIHPSMTVGATVYAVSAKIQLYPEAIYERGIDLSIVRHVRRPTPEVLDPNIKSLNYLNNIIGLVETLDEGTLEAIMLTQDGFVAEATADNLFLVHLSDGWESDPGKVTVQTPADQYGLKGVTRGVILAAARRLGYRVDISASMLPTDFVGPDREAFLTGTGAGLMPVIAVAGGKVGEGKPGRVTQRLRGEFLEALEDPEMGLRLEAGEEEIGSYLEG